MERIEVNVITGEVAVIQLTAEEIAALPAPDHAAAIKTQVRATRNARIAASDWTQLPDAPLTQAQKEAWASYRQALRDVTEQAGFPEAVEWPVAP